MTNPEVLEHLAEASAGYSQLVVAVEFCYRRMYRPGRRTRRI
jgi:hypothetical protein